MLVTIALLSAIPVPARATGEFQVGFAWIREAEAGSEEHAFAAAMNGSSVYTAGSADVGGGFLRKYDASGTLAWRQGLGSAATGLAADASGTYVAGSVSRAGQAAGDPPRNPRFLTPVGPTVYFVADGSTAGYELWMSDGTATGTEIVKDLNAGGSSFPLDLTAVGSTLFFTADDGKSGRELWKAEGRTVSLVKDLWMGLASSWPRDLTAVGSTLFFTADDGNSGRELWRSNGTAASTLKLTKLEANPRYPDATVYISELTGLGSTLFFTVEIAPDPSSFRELWKSNGTAAGTVALRPIPSPTDPADLTAAGSLLYFAAEASVGSESYGRELWVSDGTSTGTVLVKDILPGSESSTPSDFSPIGSSVFFAADDGTTGRELWRSNGKAEGTLRVTDISPDGGSQPANITFFAPSLTLLTADDGNLGRELWKTDEKGIEGIATLVKDIRPEFQAGSAPRELTVVNKRLAFTADDGSGRDLWATDGTPSGTHRISSSGALPADLTAVGQTLFFTAGDGTARELWRTDVLSGSAVRVMDFGSALDLDASVQGFTTAGASSWLRLFGSSADDGAEDVVSNGTAVYVVGWTGGALGGQTSAGGQDAFIRKYSAGGSEVWTRQFGTPQVESAIAVATDGLSVYVAGLTWGALAGQTSSGGTDAFLRKYDVSGAEVWTVQFGTAGMDKVLAVAVDSVAVYAAGETTGTMPGQANSGGTDAFLRAYDHAGGELWAAQFGSSGADSATAVASDGFAVYVAGSTTGALAGATSAGRTDAFVRKYGPGGTEAWTLQFGSSEIDDASGLVVGYGAVFVAGGTTGSLQGGTTPGQDSFLARIAETPGPVPSLRALPGDGKVALDWDPPSDGGMPVTGYRLYRGTDPDRLELFAIFDEEIRSYTDRDVENGFTYNYRIGAVNAIGEGPASALAPATPRAPPSLRITSPTVPITNNSAVTVSGVTEADAAVTVDDVHVPVAWDGTFSRTVTLPDGPHALEVLAQDVLGQTTSETVEITVDTAAPTLALTSPIDGSVTSQATTSVAGTTEAGASLVINGLDVAVGTDGGFAVLLGLRDGPNGIRATATDSAGNVAFVSVTVTADLQGGPRLEVASPTAGLTNATSVTVAGWTDPGARVAVNGVAVPVGLDGSFSTLLALVEGPNPIEVLAESDAGSTLVTRSIVRDTVAPALALSSPVDGATATEPTVIVSGITEPVASVTVNGILAAVGPDGSFSLRIALANGTNTITTTARDPVGNPRTVVRSVTYVDSLPGLQEELAETRADLEAVQDALEETRRELDEANRQLEDTRDALSAASSDLGALGDQLVLGLLAVAIVLGGIQAASLVLGRKKPPRTE